MSFRWQSVVASTCFVIVVASCAPALADQIPVEESGAVCIERDHPTNTGELCFRNDGGTIRLVGSELLQGSELTIRGGQGDELNVPVDSDVSFSMDISGQILERPLSATGTWSDGEPVNLVID